MAIKKDRRRRISLYSLVAIGVFTLLALVLFNLLNTFGLRGALEESLVEMEGLMRPAELEAISIKTDCVECFNIDKIIDVLKSSDINITDELTLIGSSQEAKTLIDKYDIKKLPTIILRGEINRTSIQDFRQVADALIFDGLTPPYVDADTGDVVGDVSAIMIEDKSCVTCGDLSLILKNLKENNVFISEEKQIDFGSTEAKQLIDRYEIKKIPALLLSLDIDVYSTIAQNLRQFVEVKGDYYIIEAQPPYIMAETGELRGLVTLIMLTDDSCEECYDVTVHKGVLTRFGLTPYQERTVDISSSEGKELMKEYNITKVSTIILTGDVAVYESLNAVWQQVGTVEGDGAYVFRELSALGGAVYKDLSLNEVIK